MDVERDSPLQFSDEEGEVRLVDEAEGEYDQRTTARFQEHTGEASHRTVVIDAVLAPVQHLDKYGIIITEHGEEPNAIPDFDPNVGQGSESLDRSWSYNFDRTATVYDGRTDFRRLVALGRARLAADDEAKVALQAAAS